MRFRKCYYVLNCLVATIKKWNLKLSIAAYYCQTTIWFSYRRIKTYTRLFVKQKTKS